MALGSLKGFMRRWADRLGPDDLEARLAQVAPRVGSDLGTDAVGFDPEFVHEAIAPALWLYRHYFRVEARGLERLPEGPCLVISNHSGQIPLDGVMIGLAALLEADPPRYLRAMAEFWVPTLPYVSIFFSRIGQLVGTPENARRLLDQGEAVLVFPEGVRGINKPITQAYQLQRFGLGFMRLALENDTGGAQEIHCEGGHALLERCADELARGALGARSLTARERGEGAVAGAGLCRSQERVHKIAP